MKLSEILSEANVIPFALLDDEVTSIAQDSRLIQPGGLFVCNPGTSTDSHQYLESAEANGATAAAVWSMAGFEKAKELGLAGFVLHEERIHFNNAICRICNVMFRYPTRNMKVLGVTGTNGKTTTAWLIRDMLMSLGLKAGYLGTLGFQIPGEERELGNTTPYPVELWSLLAEARDKGVEAMAIEVSSHALAEHRSEFVEFDVAVFTNLTQDHLDFHGTMDEYASAKFRLFNELPSQTEKPFVGALNLDDAYGRKWYRELVARGGSPRAFSTYMDDDLPGNPYDRLVGIARDIRLDGLEMEFHLRGEQVQVPLSLGGSYNVENSIAATAAVCFLGYSLQEAARAISKARPVPGRFEPVPNERGIKILVDYAHTPDALEKLLDTVRLLAKGKVITVFGCGGDRDRTKRPKMAKAASERSDLTVVTSDNPRTEDPQSILDEVVTGIVPGRNSVDIIDRRDAIAYAVKEAEPGDVVVIAGKGHENYQIIGRTKYPMDDREMARDALSRR